ncbi:MAG TPA: ABC transporter substrate-binding protein [Candidatus Acidoferrum sp.]|nr:ABC transporter substrate-binding protein [Candidatus Acidoferrum sp.]
MMPENLIPQRVASLQPSITVTLRDLGLLHRLVACTRYCVDVCPEVRETGCIIVEDSWSAKADQIMAAKPDLVIASVPYRLESVAEILKTGVPFLGLAPRTLDDIYKDIMMIARTMSLETRSESQPGTALVTRMEKEVQAMRQSTMDMERPLVYCEEWGKPLILSQTWVAELVEAAGGRFLGNPGKQMTEQEVAASDPDVIVAAWCGAGDRVPLEKIVPKRGWEQTKAAKNRRVYCINDEFLNTPASTLIQGLYALAAAIHPEMFAAPKGLRQIEENTIETPRKGGSGGLRIG